MDVSRLVQNAAKIPWVAVTIEQLRDGRLHSGLVYRDTNDQLQRVHYFWQNDLRTAPYQSEPCAVPALDPADGVFLSAYFKRIALNGANNFIPFNLSYYDNVSFDAEGSVQIGTSTGLYCSTFVLCAFRAGRTELIDMSDWPAPDAAGREEQVTYYRRLAESDDPETQRQAARVALEVGMKWVRADHVAAACLEDNLPANYEQCERNSHTVVTFVELAEVY